MSHEQTQRPDRVIEVVREVRHAINSPLTAIMAEVDLMLMDADRLDEEQRNSLKTIGEMARRIRDLNTRLRDLDADG